MAIKVVLAGTAKKGHLGLGTCPPLEQALVNEGFELGNLENSQVLINLNHNESSLKTFDLSSDHKKFSFLVLLEPKSVYPSQYASRTLDKYDFCFYPGNRLRQSLEEEILGWPYLYNENPANPGAFEIELSDYLENIFSEQIFELDKWSARKNQITMIAANKVSPTNENLYSLRRMLASSLVPGTLKLYGPLWSESLLIQLHHRLAVLVFALKSGYRPNVKSLFGNLGKRYPAALGTVSSKHAVLKDSKFSLVIENSSENITEKLFDSLINGAIPIYIGPELEKSEIPPGVAIQGIENANLITQILENISSEEILKHLESMRSFLKSPAFLEVWSANHVYKRIASEISRITRAGE